MPFILETFTAPPFAENTYLLADTTAGEAVVIDPGGRVPDILRVAELRGVRIGLMVATHAHIDHVAGVEELRAHSGAPFWLHDDAVPSLAGLPGQAVTYNIPPFAIPRVDGPLVPGQVITVGSLHLRVRFTPGHAPGHVTLVLDGPAVALDEGDQERPFAFCGDVIFQNSIGRTDLADGDYERLMQSIEREILTLPPETVLYSGHGPATTVGTERRFNPFVREWIRQRV